MTKPTAHLYFFYLGEEAPIFGTDLKEGILRHPYRDFLPLRMMFEGQDVTAPSLPLQLRRDRIPSDACWVRSPYNTVLHPSYPVAYGHAVIDDMLPLWRVLQRFNIHQCANGDVSIWLAKEWMQTSKQWDADSITTANQHLEFFSRGMTTQPIRQLGLPETYSTAHCGAKVPNLMCFPHLVAGSAVGKLRNFEERLFRDYFNALLSSILSIDELRGGLTEQHIVFVKKVGRRAPTNMMQMVLDSKRYFGCNVSYVNPAELSDKEQVELARSATVIVTPCGSISFFTAFMRPMTTRIIVDYLDVSLDPLQTGKMEAFMWQWDDSVRTLHYPLLSRSSVALDPPAEAPDPPMPEYLLWRSFGRPKLNFTVLSSLIRTGMVSAARSYRL
jgi:Glycosyltransferase 61